MLDQVGDSVSNDPCFARAGTSQNQYRPAQRLDRTALLGIQRAEIQHRGAVYSNASSLPAGNSKEGRKNFSAAFSSVPVIFCSHLIEHSNHAIGMFHLMRIDGIELFYTKQTKETKNGVLPPSGKFQSSRTGLFFQFGRLNSL